MPPAPDTRERLVQAAAETLRAEGFAGTTARSIARTGGLNQALVFYHWGSVDELLLAALDRSVTARLEAYAVVLDDCSTVRAVLDALPALYAEDVASGHVDLLCELVAGGVARRELGRQVAARVQPWTDLVEATLRRVLPAPLRRRVPWRRPRTRGRPRRHRRGIGRARGAHDGAGDPTATASPQLRLTCCSRAPSMTTDVPDTYAAAGDTR